MSGCVSSVHSSVVDPGHFGTGTDPDPRIHGSMDPDPAFFVLRYYFLKPEGTFASVLTDNKSKRSKRSHQIKVFLTFCLLMEGSGSGRSKNIRILPDPDPQHWSTVMYTNTVTLSVSHSST